MNPHAPAPEPPTASYNPAPDPHGIWMTSEPVGAAPPPKRKSRLPWILAAVGAIVLLLILAVAITAGIAVSGGKTPGAPLQTAQPIDAGPVAEDTPTTEPTGGPTPAVSDFTLTLKTREKHCFGSAGCLLTVQPDMTYGGPTLTEDDTWEVTYEITGVEDAPVIGTLTVTGPDYEGSNEHVRTSGSGAKPKIKVTDVEQVG